MNNQPQMNADYTDKQTVLNLRLSAYICGELIWRVAQVLT